MSSMRTETSVGKDKKSLAASKASKPAPKGSLQLAQIKNLLIDFKGQIKEKKKNTVDTVQKTGSSKNRGGNLSNSNSVSRGNTSMDKNRTSQRSQDQSNRVIKSIDKSDKMKAFKKKDNVAISKEGARSSSNLKNGMKLSAGNSKSINNTSISSVKLTKPVGRTNDSRSSAKLTSSSKEPKIGRSTDYTEKRSLDDSRKDLSLVATSDVTKESTKKTKQNGLASSINTNAAKMSLKSGLGSSASKPKKNAVEKSKTEENDENEDFEDSRYKTYTQEQYDFSENTPDTQNMKDFKKKPTEKNGQNSKLNSLVTQVRQGQMFPDFSSKKVDLDRELEIISSNRSHRDRINQNQHGKITHEGSGEWNKYYVNSLIQALGSNDDNDPEVKLFKEHFFQTVQSIVFLQNVEKIDDSLLVEKKVYLPPNFMKRKTLILDLDETLVHCNETLDIPHDHKINIKFANGDEVETGINIRPYAIEFLKKMSEIYEVMIFTASHSCYANVVLNILDPHNEYITFRLFRDQCLQTNEGIFIKDLRIIANRSLDNMLIVDNATYSFGFQVENGIPIVPFYDNPNDTELLDLMVYLQRLTQEQDVRKINNKLFMYEIISHYCNDYEKLTDIICSQNNN